jgi:hypothetical protein
LCNALVRRVFNALASHPRGRSCSQRRSCRVWVVLAFLYTVLFAASQLQGLGGSGISVHNMPPPGLITISWQCATFGVSVCVSGWKVMKATEQRRASSFGPIACVEELRVRVN